jgi:cell division protein FtsB
LKKKKRAPQFPLTQFIAIVVITISLFLVVDFARRTAATYKIRNEAVRLEEEVTAARARHQALETRLSYVQSDAYVEEIARTQLKWAQPGETVVVVMATPQAAPPVSPGDRPVAADGTPLQSPWQAWWFRFFNVPPPM